MSLFTIKQILKDHWSSFSSIYAEKIRPVVSYEVNKVINCGDLSNGFTTYMCPSCHRIKLVPFRCHSRFCNTCGVAYQLDRSANISAKLFKCKHRHVVFTIPEQLREYFRKDRSLLHVLFHSAAQVISFWANSLNKKENFSFGMVLGLHTFGRDLKWNPHIHMLLSEGAVGNNTPWRKFSYFPFIYLRKSWMNVLLKNILSSLNSKIFNIQHFKNLVSKLYNSYKDGFYVHAPCVDFNSPEAVANYITRYIGRPTMAQSRITNYDGKNVTFWYQRHEDNKKVSVTLSAFDFIKSLIIHIPEKSFNMLRYYGAYAKPFSSLPDIRRCMNRIHLKFYRHNLRRWAIRLELSFQKDPLKCICGERMKFFCIYDPHASPINPEFVLKY